MSSSSSLQPYAHSLASRGFHSAPFNKKEHGRKIHILSPDQADERITGMINTHALRQKPLKNIHSKENGQTRGWSQIMRLLPPGVTLCIGFGAVLNNTITSWGTQTVLHNIGQVSGLAAMVFLGSNAIFTYRRHQNEIENEIERAKIEAELERIETENKKNRELALDRLKFLKESAQMAAACSIENPDPRQLSVRFLEFNLFITTLKAKIAPADLEQVTPADLEDLEKVLPADLVAKWKEIGEIIESSENDPLRASLPKFVQTKIMPRITYYMTDAQEALIALNDAAFSIEIEASNENDRLVHDLAPRDYQSIQTKDEEDV